MIPPMTSPTMNPKIQLDALAAGSLSRACSSPSGSTTISGVDRSVVSAAGTSTLAVVAGCVTAGRRVRTGATTGRLVGAAVGAAVGAGVFGGAAVGLGVWQ
jgi:hypothetical protein